MTFFFTLLSPRGVAGCTPASSMGGTTTMEGGTWLVLAALGFGLEKNLRNLKPLGRARGGAMAMAMAKTQMKI
jgi:hypothetical protein